MVSSGGQVEGELSWAELSPAFGYTGLRLRTRKLDDGHDVTGEPTIEAVDQFAQEIDHMSLCVQRDLKPHTPGEEGLQDIRIIEAIYESARTGKTVNLNPWTVQRAAPIRLTPRSVAEAVWRQSNCKELVIQILQKRSKMADASVEERLSS